MSNYTLDTFVKDSRAVILEKPTPAECTERIVPLMHKLLTGDKGFLKPEHFRSDPNHYTRNAIYIDDNKIMSLYAIVWEPNQWTPIHDHGTWGVVGIHESALEERNFMRIDKQGNSAKQNIDLIKSSSIRLSPESVTSFVPNPDHIHVTGNPTKKHTVSLHLYGNEMAGFYIYNKEARTRKWTAVTCNENQKSFVK